MGLHAAALWKTHFFLYSYKPFLISLTIMAPLVTEIQQGTEENPHIKLLLNALHQS